MEIRDLMIGDWVCYSKPNNYCTKVNEIKCTHDVPDDMLYYIKGQRDNRDRLKNEFDETFIVDILSPIPITPEILEKNGWINEHFGTQRQEYWLDNTKFSVVKYSTNSHFQHNGIALSYVHQLQHALRLCGIEKEIIL